MQSSAMMRDTATFSFGLLLAFAPLIHTLARAAEPAQPMVFRLAEPETRPLSGEQIKALISNRKVEIDDKFEAAPGRKLKVRYAGGCRTQEIFAADGRWQMAQCQIQSRVYQGRWTVEPFRNGHRLCVEADDYIKECRFVWQGSNPDQIIMALGTPIGAKFDDWFSPYQLTKWSGQMWQP